jgi:4'-phosphopantetheinyl transferase
MQSADIYWPTPPDDCSLEFGSRPRSPAPAERPLAAVPEIQVWAVALEVAPETYHSLAAVLSPPERERAGQFRIEQHRKRFVVGRGVLRTLLGRSLQTDPHGLEFDYGQHGKPFLAGAFAGSGLHFNLAHSQDLALIALTLAGPVGIDVEQVRLPADADQLMARFFSAEESSAFTPLPEDQKPAAFFRLWTRKEARLKATGEGIGSLIPTIHSIASRAGKDAGDNVISWIEKELTPAPGFAGALSVAAAEAKVSCWRYD